VAVPLEGDLDILVARLGTSKPLDFGFVGSALAAGTPACIRPEAFRKCLLPHWTSGP
jgi:hypothetical protein